LFDQDPENPNKKKDCAWLTYDESRRSRKCHQNGGLNKAGNKPNKAQLKCPASCGVQGCCADDLTFTFKIDGGARVDCAWITANTKKLEKRQGYCTKKKRVGGHCLKACDRCLEGLPDPPKKKNKKN